MATKEVDMLSRKGLLKNMCLFIAPLMFTGILQLLYTASDLIICGSFGPENSTAAISETNQLINLIVNLFLGFSVGANVLMARAFGAGEREKGEKIVHSAMLLSVIVGLFVGIFGAVFSRYFLVWMGAPSDIIDLSTEYLAIYFIGIPFTMIYNFGSSILRATGDTKKPFLFLTISGVVNILLNLLFVIVFNLGVAGVAICTSISQFVAATMTVFYLRFKKGMFFEFRFKKMRFFKNETLGIINVGLPAGLQAMIFSLSNVMIQSSINSLGTQVVGGNGASSSLEGFVYTSMNSVAQGAVTFASANYGAHKYSNVKSVILYALFLVVAVWAAMSALILLLRNSLLGFYVHTPEAIEAGNTRLIIILSTYFLCGFMDTFAYALRSIGYSVLPTVISACGACGLRLLWVFFIFPLPYFNNLKWLAISYPISWALTLITHIIFFTILYSKLLKKASREAEPDIPPAEVF